MTVEKTLGFNNRYYEVHILLLVNKPVALPREPLETSYCRVIITHVSTNFDLSLALFLVRNLENKEQIPDELKPDFLSEESFLQEKLQTLKKIVSSTFPVRIFSFYDNL